MQLFYPNFNEILNLLCFVGFERRNTMLAATEYLKREVKNDIGIGAFALCMCPLECVESSDSFGNCLSILSKDRIRGLQFEVVEILTGYVRFPLTVTRSQFHLSKHIFRYP